MIRKWLSIHQLIETLCLSPPVNPEHRKAFSTFVIHLVTENLLQWYYTFHIKGLEKLQFMNKDNYIFSFLQQYGIDRAQPWWA